MRIKSATSSETEPPVDPLLEEDISTWRILDQSEIREEKIINEELDAITNDNKPSPPKSGFFTDVIESLSNTLSPSKVRAKEDSPEKLLSIETTPSRESNSSITIESSSVEENAKSETSSTIAPTGDAHVKIQLLPIDHTIEDEKSTFLDEYGFTVPLRNKKSYDDSQEKLDKKLKKLNKGTWKDVVLTTSTKLTELELLVKHGIPNKEQRAMIWMLSSGAAKKKENANSNSESGCYYIDLLEKSRKNLDISVIGEIEKDVTRTFPGHEMFDNIEGQEKLKRVLEAYATRNEVVGYCQSMNFIAGMGLIMSSGNEEDAFWLLTTIVEDFNPGKYSKTMIQLQIDTLVLEDLIVEYFPELSKHMKDSGFQIVIMATKWFMCLFVGSLPTETLFRVWDFYFLYGMRIAFKAALAIISTCHDDLMNAKDTMEFWLIIQNGSQSIFDSFRFFKAIKKLKDVTDEKIAHLRNAHKASVVPLKRLQQNTNQNGTSDVNNPLASILSRLDGFFFKGKSFKRDPSIMDLSPAIERKLIECLKKHVVNPVDFISTGTGTRFYPDGKKYQGSFHEGKRHGVGALFNEDGSLLYNGSWKNDKREGHGTSNESNGTSYNGEWKNDQKHGKGEVKLNNSKIVYNGEWKFDRREGFGVMIYSNGDQFEGFFKNNKRTGNGTYIWISSKDKYEGNWENDKIEGKGKMFYGNGDTYEGDWKNNSRHGKGKMIYSMGDTYEGEWKEDLMEGHGTYTFSQPDTLSSTKQDDNNSKQDNTSNIKEENVPQQQQQQQQDNEVKKPIKWEGSFKGGLRIDTGNKYWPNGIPFEEPTFEKPAPPQETKRSRFSIRNSIDVEPPKSPPPPADGALSPTKLGTSVKITPELIQKLVQLSNVPNSSGLPKDQLLHYYKFTTPPQDSLCIPDRDKDVPIMKRKNSIL